MIGIDSTTIDDRFHPSRTEVSSTATIDGQKVDDAHIENLQQVLQSIPGMTTEITSGDSMKIHIRGVENQRYMGEKPGVAVVIDGVPVFERTGSVNIDLDDIASIKVIKGGASYLFGDDALAGAVIITTKKGAVNKSTIATEVGSFGEHKLLGETSFSKDSFNGRIQVSERKSDGYWKDSNYLTRYANGKLQYYIDDTSDLTFGAEVSHREKDSHGSVGGVTQAQNDPQSISVGSDGGGRDYARKFDVDLLKFFLTYSKDFGNNSNLLVNVYQYADDTTFISAPQQYTLAKVKVTDENAYTTLNDYHQIQRGLKSEYRDSGDKLAYLLGADIRHNTYENKTSNLIDFRTSLYSAASYAGTITGDNKTTEAVYAPYAEVKVPLGDTTTLTLNGRYDNIRLDSENHLTNINTNKNFDVYSHRIGLTQTINDNVTLFVTRSTGFRAPSLDQLFNGTVAPGSKTYPNPNLKPEESINYDVGIRGALPVLDNSLTYETTLFWLDRSDYIMSSIGQYAAATTTYPQQYQNIGGMRSKGLELSLKSDAKKTFSFDIAYTYLDSYFTQYENFYLTHGSAYSPSSQTHYNLTGNTVPRTSRHTLNVIGNYNVSPLTLISTELTARSSYYADELNQAKMPGYEVVNLLVKHNEKWDRYSFDFFARIDNVLDKYYYNSALGSSDGNNNGYIDGDDLTITVNPGRVFTAGLSVKF
jgi:iron complex outermembrane receptor protein